MEEKTILWVEGLEDCSISIERMISLLTEKQKEGYTTIRLSCIGEGAMGGGADAYLSVS